VPEFNLMFGTYRFILASLVALSHFGLIVAGFNPGQWSVLSFYVLSGYLMEHLFHKLSSTTGNSRAFYCDRFLRVFPVYFAVLLLAAFLTPTTWTVFLANAVLIPLNYSQFTGIPLLIGPAWSLACEVHFYLLVPLLVRAPTPVLRLIAAGSMVFFVVSTFLPNTGFWAYAGLPGILFAFLTGILIKRKDLMFLRGAWLAFAILLAGFAGSKLCHLGLSTGIHINVCIGYLAAVPLVSWLSTFPPDAKWDRRLGLVSYPLFLVHQPLGSFLAAHLAHANMFLLLFFGIAGAGVLVLLVEQPCDIIRYKMRKLLTTNREVLSKP
jgi:peptidoglycan/LPS O-acetylase OafA/YrhL